mmetsp:Transcript_23047/g.25247  ORF Transcript_23047/g.25247 Transcript_23047/m.25247 type:complete len:83 (+) Transcript_23047:204-452(+)
MKFHPPMSIMKTIALGVAAVVGVRGAAGEIKGVVVTMIIIEMMILAFVQMMGGLGISFGAAQLLIIIIQALIVEAALAVMNP